MHIGFLFNHRIHQVFHTAPVAFQLSSLRPEIDVTAVAANSENLELLEQLATRYPGQHVQLKQAYVPLLVRIAHQIVHRQFSLEKPVVKLFNRELLATFDALVVPEATSIELRNIHGLEHLRMICLPHGAGDREASFDKRFGTFDLLLLPGRKTRDRMREFGCLPGDGHFKIVGYPKFDAAQSQRHSGLFTNGRPIVLYNPHFSSDLSSWPGMGLPLLEFFHHSDQFNLIFSPHIMLFERAWKFHSKLPIRYRQCPSILIDTGSARGSDMTYTRSADIYVGDVSSQIYEFLIHPRPCIFLNAHAVQWRNNPFYDHWQFGQVIDDIADLGAALDDAQSSHDIYVDKQREAIAYTFDLRRLSSSVRAADAIFSFMQDEMRKH